MNADERLSPEAFARLLALPEDHPERVAAERTPQFAALRLLLAEFEAAPAAADADASAELARRLATGTAATPARVTPLPPARPAPRRNETAVRVAIAAAGIAIAGAAWWGTTHLPGATPPERMIRGEHDASAFVLQAPPPEPGRIVLEWTRVPDAQGYRIVFLGSGLAEVSHLDVGDVTRIDLAAAELPPGLPHGARVSVEVSALHGADPIATTATRTILLP